VPSIGLNRDELIVQRKERLERILPLVDEVALMHAGLAQTVMMGALRQEMSPAVEYSATMAAHLTAFIQHAVISNARL
jgi:hypothetical protein